MKLIKSFKAGDIIEIDRILYKHYGIYDGDGMIIHYTADNGDFGINVTIRETNLEQFAKDGNCKVVKCIKNCSKIIIFSPEETVSRARSRLGEKSIISCLIIVSISPYGVNTAKINQYRLKKLLEPWLYWGLLLLLHSS